MPYRLPYASQAFAFLRSELQVPKALLGFGGSPWTLAFNMVEGGRSNDLLKIEELSYNDRSIFSALTEKLTESLVGYFKL